MKVKMLTFSEEEWKKIREEACICHQEGERAKYTDILETEKDLGVLGKLEIDTFFYWGDVPQIMTDYRFIDLDGAVYYEDSVSIEIQYCPFCGRKFGGKRK